MRVIEIFVSRTKGEGERIQRRSHAFRLICGNPPHLDVVSDRPMSDLQSQGGLADATEAVKNCHTRLGDPARLRRADDAARVFQKFGAAA